MKKTEAKPKRRGNPENIKPYRFKPGQSGNPGGRPKKKPLTEALQEMLAEMIKLGGKNQSKAKLLAEALFREALKGNIQAFEEIADRVEGKAVQGLQLSGPGGGAIPIEPLTPEENERRIKELLAKGGMA